MEGFDTMTMPYLASPLSLGNMQSADYLSAMPGMDIQEQRSNYDAETFASDDVSFVQQHGLPSAAALNRFSAAPPFEDPFAEMMPSFEPLPAEKPPPQDSSSNIDTNNKLLSFSLPVYSFTLLDYSLRRTSLSLSAQLHGMFFLAESPWTNSQGEAAPPQVAELTCYRRNLFQITGSVTLPRTLRYIMTDQGDRIPIIAQELTVSATESVEGNSVKIISVPWKTPAANPPAPVEDKVEKEPPSIPLDTMAGQDMDSDYATFPIAWKRLQFRIATANNGRRKELQQHFVVRLKVVATLSTGTKIPICEAHSGPVIVRGRSPRNFQSRKDLPLSGSAASSRKSQAHAQAQAQAQAQAATTASRSPRSDGGHQITPTQQSKTPPEVPQMSFQFDAASDTQHAPQQSTSPYSDWTNSAHPNAATLPTPTFTSTMVNGGLPVYAQSSPEVGRPNGLARTSSTATAPINLSLVDDDTIPPMDASPTSKSGPKSERSSSLTGHKNTRKASDSGGPPPAKLRKMSQSQQRPMPPTYPLLANQQPRHHQQSTAYIFPMPSTSSLIHPNDGADILYEYFPLGLDDWQAPVDAVYRPHVVHHTNMPVDPKAIAARSRSKRYFAEDVY